MITKNEIKDPRLQPMAVITEVGVTKDLKYAKVYVSFYGRQELLEHTVEALNHATGFIQGTLGKRLRLRMIPRLTFLKDTSIERGFRVTQKLKDIFP